MIAIKTRYWYVTTAVLVAFDQITKTIANARLALYDYYPVIDHFNWTLVYNEGAAFSFLSDAGGWQRWFFAVLSAAVSALIIVWLYRLPTRMRWLPAALAFILAGAIGNLIDRVIFGHVIDFVQFYYRADSCLPGFFLNQGVCYWPVFNVADMAISVGVGLMLVNAFIVREDESQDR